MRGKPEASGLPIATAPYPGASSETIAELRRHPQFAKAMLRAARSAVELYQGSRITNLITNDRGRFLLAIAPLHLHHMRHEDDPSSGFTASRLKQFAREQAICSAGRAAAMLAMMRWAGMISRASATSDRRVRLLQPTDKLLDMHRVRWRQQLQAASIVLPDLAEAAEQCDTDTFVYAFGSAQTRQYVSGFRFMDMVPELDLFVDRSAGLLVLSSLLLSDASDGGVSRSGLTVSSSALARRFHVSRTHVVKMLRDAASRRLIMRDERSSKLSLTPELREASERFFAGVFLYNSSAAQSAMTEVRDGMRPGEVPTGLRG